MFVLLRLVAGLGAAPQPAGFATDRVVVVGVTGRPTLTELDRRVLGERLDGPDGQGAQVGSISTRTRYLGECAAAGWATLGAGRPTTVGGRCDPQVVDGRVADWPGHLAAAAGRAGDARLGTLAAAVEGAVPRGGRCVAAVGAGAALAAARPDGTLAAYDEPSAFLATGLPLRCRITLVAAGPDTDRVIAALAERDDLTLVVTGIGPAPGSTDPSLPVVYRLGSTPGWLTSASTRRKAVVTLPDLTRTLVEFVPGEPEVVPALDGSPLAVVPAALSVPAVEDQLAATRALSDDVLAGYYTLAVAGSLLGVVLAVALLRRRWALARGILTFGTILLAAMMVTGALPWSRAERPGLAVTLGILGVSAVLTAAALLLARVARIPAAVAGAVVSVAAFTVDAALGGPMQPGSLINSRPVYGLRWYGFGNVTFAGYAVAGLLLAGWLASRLRAVGRPRAAAAAVAAVGLGVVACEGWPSMGSDFGGVVALTPPVLWLALVLGGVRLTWPRLLLVGASAAVAVGLISVVDWARGPDRRSHLGSFVQRVLDGDAYEVVVRKALAAAATVATPQGVLAVVLGIACWWAVFRYAVPLLERGFATVRPTLVAALATAVLGSLLNDGGIGVWTPVTGWVTAACLGLLVEQRLRSAHRW